ncbi:BTB/POZ domain-containing protein FBL11 isoform X3 [Macadamia integrifolia]|uniref:BTB/POZ domain-containing protein FBL11 isoform X3 n=1 Tax=Macadamia integrifolia TaxID=60698 RepID=UPI001C4F466D|nr:BTB/POZ domain-containing protein FBL11 isoform X3 [Macadamia integrifolia]
MASASIDDLVIIEFRDPLSTQPEVSQKEIFISTSEVHCWNLPLILSCPIVKVQANRNRLIEESSYFRGLLGGSFRESCLDCISVDWNLETITNVLKFMYGCQLDLTSKNFVKLLEGALFFGVESLLLECKSWFSETTSSRGLRSLQITVDDIVEIWNFGLENAVGFTAEICTDYLAKNFVQLSLLPLWFAAGKRRDCYFSKLADESCNGILNLVNDPSTTLRCILRHGGFQNLRIRLTEFMERVDLSDCPQITTAFLQLALCSYSTEPLLPERVEQSLIEHQNLVGDKYPISRCLVQSFSFEAVHVLDISKWSGVHFEAAIELFCKLFPSLRTLKASYCLNFRMTTLYYLVQKFSLVDEVDLTVDVSPAIPMQVSTISTNIESYRDLSGSSYKMIRDELSLSSITKLTLKGRSDINDMDLERISSVFASLSHLNIKGCTSVTDVGISKLICKCMELHSLVVSDTRFGRNSILSLCSSFPSEGFPVVHCEQKNSTSFAFRLQKLNIGGCKSVDETSLLLLLSHTFRLKSLCMRGTVLADDALCNFFGSSLERVDVSDTMVSETSLIHIIRRNPGLRLFKARGCRNLCHGGSRQEEGKLTSEVLSYHGCSPGEDMYFELGRKCMLEEAAFGWGFSPFSLKHLGPAIKSLRAIAVGLGASFGHYELTLLHETCPMLESVVLHFQVISDVIVKSIVESLKHLKVLGLCYCLGDLSSLSFYFSMPSLRKLRLERVTPWMKNADLVILTQSCPNLIELSLSGCKHLNSESQRIISNGWPGLISIHLEECGEVTMNGASSLFDCKAIEDLSLRHNGCGIQRSFVVDAASKLPMLRKLSLDLCDANEGGFDSPSCADRFSLSIIKIARCKQWRCPFNLQKLDDCRRPLHKETIILEWNSKELRTTVVKERV